MDLPGQAGTTAGTTRGTSDISREAQKSRQGDLRQERSRMSCLPQKSKQSVPWSSTKDATLGLPKVSLQRSLLSSISMFARRLAGVGTGED